MTTNEKPKKRISAREFAEKAAKKIITDNKLRELVYPLNNEEDVVFYYKPLTNSEFLNAQATLDAGKAVEHILASTLWDPDKGKNGDFWTVEEVRKGIPFTYQTVEGINSGKPFTWQTLILEDIVEGEGHVLTESDKDF